MRSDEQLRPRILSVMELTSYLRSVLANDSLLQNVWVRGEISDFKFYQKSGHMYFCLKDEESSVNCVMFRSRARHIDFVPDNGLKVLARGYLSIFEKYGRYQFYVEEMEPDGWGRFFLALAQLKERLEKEGLFDPGRKRPIPKMVNCVGVVTSLDGAAIRDIVRVIRLRHPACDIVVAPSSVQGSEAHFEIARGIEALNEWGKAEVLIVGRGGGSLEDLLAFSTEEVVRAIAASRIPVISAVGHEIDFSLADLAADARAATPTQAGQMAVPDIFLIEEQLTNMVKAMERIVERNLNQKIEQLEYLKEQRIWKRPETLVYLAARELKHLYQEMLNLMQSGIGSRTNQLEQAAVALDALSPLKVLNRGYSIVRKETGEVMRMIDQVEPDEELGIVVTDGELKVKVLEKRLKEWKI